jgi:hypothetical protein
MSAAASVRVTLTEVYINGQPVVCTRDSVEHVAMSDSVELSCLK